MNAASSEPAAEDSADGDVQPAAQAAATSSASAAQRRRQSLRVLSLIARFTFWTRAASIGDSPYRRERTNRARVLRVGKLRRKQAHGTLSTVSGVSGRGTHQEK